MSGRQTVSRIQMKEAERILRALQSEIKAEYIGLVSASGVSLIALSSSDATDIDSLASLAAGSFAATRQLATMLNEECFTIMFHEGRELNIQIARATEDILIVVCFRGNTELGKVRLISKRALNALAVVLGDRPVPANPGPTSSDLGPEENDLDETNSGGRASGTD